MKIAILNQPLSNRGDESAHKAFVKALCKALPQTQIDVLFFYEKQERIDAIKVSLNNLNYIVLPKYRFIIKPQIYSLLLQCQSLSFLHPGLRKFKNKLNEYDIIICAPGGICMGGFLNWLHIWQLLVAKKLNKPIMYWGRSIGPFSDNDYKHKIFKKYSYELLHNFKYISLRDTKSVEIANNIGISVDEVVDSAFFETPNVKIPNMLNQKIKNSEYIVFVPNQLTWHYRYKNIPQSHIDNFYLFIINELQKKYKNIKIIMLPQIYDSSINDYAYFLKLKELSKCPNVLVVDENQNSDIQQTIISKSKLVIGARYHSIIFAINNNIPFISLSYEHKMKGIIEKLNYKENLIEIQDIFDKDSEQLLQFTKQRFKKILNNGCITPDSKKAKKILNNGFNNMIKTILLYK